MNDIELLELAAKAAGYWDATFNCYKGPMNWDPLENDGDALKLVVRLGLTVEIGYTARGFLVVSRTNTDNWQEFREAWGNNPYAAARRAIVRAAAKIGEAW